MFTVSHVVDAVQVLLSFFIVHVLAFGSNDFDGVMAEENLTGRPAEELVLILNTCKEYLSHPWVELVFIYLNNIIYNMLTSPKCVLLINTFFFFSYVYSSIHIHSKKPNNVLQFDIL